MNGYIFGGIKITHNTKKIGPLFLLIAFICLIAGVSCIHAADIDNRQYMNQSDIEDTVLAEAGDFEIENLECEPAVILARTNPTANTTEDGKDLQTSHATYNNLRDDIENLNPGEVYNITRDYLIDNCDSTLSKNRIINIYSDNVFINGNGHTINGNGCNGYFALFKILGNNITIMNLHIANFRSTNTDYCNSKYNRYGYGYTKVTSPIEWHGDNGTISNCRFDDNAGVDGGAIYWIADNGRIDNCYFNENTADRGGSVFISGYNNTISSCIMKDSYSHYLDAIFFKNFNESGEEMTFEMNDCFFHNSNDYINDIHVEGQCRVMDGDKQIYPEIPEGRYDDFLEVTKNLKDGDIYNLTRDYYFDYTCQFYPIMANNVTINGNGHIIHCRDEMANSIIWVMGNNVNINTMIFDIDEPAGYGSASFVNWKGNNGSITDCAFTGNHVRNGGAVTWTGNDGLIDNCIFINNTASVAGGAIVISGLNNIISNSIFLNCSSLLTGEAIFIDHKRKNITLENISFDNAVPVIDEGATSYNIDIEQFSGNGYYRWVGEKYYEISRPIYASIMKGGINYLNDNTYYKCDYNNVTGIFDFTISVVYNEHNITYSQAYLFKNIFNYTFSDVFSKLMANDYETSFTITKTIYISSSADYTNTVKNTFCSVAPIAPVMGIFEWDMGFANNVARKEPVTYALDVIFTKALTIECNSTWDLKSSIFDVLNVNGAGSVIKGSYDDGKEDKWVVLKKGHAVGATDITIEGFNTAVENLGGQCMFMLVNFNNNRMDYIIDRDWGAGILNTGMLTCINCSFTNNYAKNGAAIFNQGILTIQDCIFKGNNAYGEGDDICVGDGGKVIYDGVLINCTGECPHVEFPNSLSVTDSTLITVFSYASSFLVGAAVGLVTANPLVGLAVGACLGAAIGTGFSACINTLTYDINHDRLGTCLNLIIGSSISGALGGYMGGAMGEIRNELWAFDFDIQGWTNSFRPGLAWAATCIGVSIVGTLGGLYYYFTN